MKIKQRGYWVSKVYKWISVLYWSFYSVYFRTLTYFSAANPKIYLGGMLDERKSDIYAHIPDRFLPKTDMYSKDRVSSVDLITKEFSFPLIVKPNVGYKGFMVRRVDSSSQLESAIAEHQGKEFLIQEFLTEPHEYSVMYYFVNDRDFGITSLVEKHLPKIVGDGHSSLGELIEDLKNPFLKKNWIKQKHGNHLDQIPEKGKTIVIDHVGNYSRGSNFENLNPQIDLQLKDSIHTFLQQVNGMFFCRLDVKANSLQDLKEGKFKLLEINGVKSEPLHIYDPSYSFVNVIRSIHIHWRTLFRVVKANIKFVDFPSSLEGIRSYFSLKKMVS